MAEDNDWFNDPEALAEIMQGQEGVATDQNETDWFNDPAALSELMGRERAGPAQIEQELKGSPFSVGVSQLAESSGGVVRPLLAAPAALVSTADRMISGRSDGLTDTFSDEYGRWSRQFGYGAAGDPTEDTRAERVARVGGETLGTTLEGIALLGGSMMTRGLQRGGTLAYQLFRRMSLPSKPTSKLGEVREAASNFAGEMIESFLKSPAKFSSVEAVSGAGAAGGAAMAEAISPGNPVTRFLAEVAGGTVGPFTTPIKTIARASGETGALSGMFDSFGRSRAEAAVADRLQRTLELAGQDGEQLVRQLADFNARVTSGELANLPSGTATGNPALISFEAAAAKRTASVGGQRKEMIENAFRSYNQVIDGMLQTGNPEDLVNAARLARAHYEDLIDTSIGTAQERAFATLARFEGFDPKSASREAYQILSDSLSQARSVEDALWNAVPKDIPAEVGELQRVANQLGNQLLPSQSLPFQSDINRFISNSRLGSPQGTTSGTTTGDLINLRKNLLSESRRLRRAGDSVNAGLAEQLAAATRRSLEASGLDEGLARNAAYVRATSFSNALNSRFADTFAGRVDQRGRSGDLVSPEQLLDTAFGSSRSRSARARQDATNNLRAVQEASAETSVARVQGQDARRETNWSEWFDTSVLGRQAQSVQEEFLRGVVARDFVQETPDGPIVNQRQLRNFMNDNPQLMEDFPILAADLQDATSAQYLLQDVQNTGRVSRRELQEQAFSKLIGDTPAETVVSDFVFSRKNANAKDNLRNLVQIINDSPNPEQARAGLRSASLAALFRQAGRREGDNFFDNLDTALNSPIYEGGPPARELFSDMGIFRDQELVRLDRVIAAGKSTRQNAGAAATVDVEEAAGIRNALEDFALRVQGAWLGGKVGSLTGRPGGLVEAEAGSKFARYLFKRMPGAHAQELLERAILDPKYMQRLLEMQTGGANVSPVQLSKQLDAFMLSAGYEYAIGEDFENAPSPFLENPDLYIPD